MVVEPCAVQARVPIWVGGRSGRSLRRAVELGDGWAPFGLSAPRSWRCWPPPGRHRRGTARARPLDVILQSQRAFDPGGSPEATAAEVEALARRGATGLALRFVHHSPDHYIEQMAAMVEVVATVTDQR